jgi:cytochrome c oxidase assembly factor CtaG
VTSLLPPSWHPALAVALVVLAAGYAIATTRPSTRATRIEQVRFASALAVTWVACAWPLGDLAAHVSITATVLQRLLLMLAVAPLVVLSVPIALVARCTRPAPLDRLSSALCHPAVAILLVTVVGTVTLAPAVVTWGATSSAAGAVVVAVTLLVGMVLWLPVLGRAPGTRRLSYVAKGGYLMAASLVVTSLSFVWIFSRHVLYPSLSHQHAILAMSPIVDQQLAGYVAKFGAYVPLWAVAFVLFARSSDREEDDGATLRWVDVERELERADRHPRDAGGADPGDATG